MSRYSRSFTFAVLSILWCGVSASAETLRCQSVNGNVNCAGSGAVSCQTVNGKKVCVGGHGDVIQSFGGRSSGEATASGKNRGGDENPGGKEDLETDEDLDGGPSGPVMKQRLERRDGRGRTLLLEREGQSLHLRSDWLSVDRN